MNFHFKDYNFCFFISPPFYPKFEKNREREILREKRKIVYLEFHSVLMYI